MFAERELKGTRIFTFSEFSQLPHFIFAVSSRQTDSDIGCRHETEDLDRREGLSRAFSIESGKLFTLQQVHSARTVVLDGSWLKSGTPATGPADGVIVSEPGLFAAIRTADCLPVVVVCPENKKVALFHMGWRGARQRILEKGLNAFLALSGADPEHLVVGLGPCIRSCCYEVGDEVIDAFEQAGFRLEDILVDRHLDLIATAKTQLLECGVPGFLDSGLCTACRTDRFYSYRREATSSRIWTLAGFETRT